MSGAGSMSVAQSPTTITVIRAKPWEFTWEGVGETGTCTLFVRGVSMWFGSCVRASKKEGATEQTDRELEEIQPCMY